MAKEGLIIAPLRGRDKSGLSSNLRAIAGKNQKNPYIMDIRVSPKMFFLLIYVEILMNGL